MRKHGKTFTYLLVLLLASSIFLNQYFIRDIYKKIGIVTQTQQNVSAITPGVVDLHDEFHSFADFVVNYYERKPDFQILQKANVRMKIGRNGGSGTVIGLEKDYTYVLTAKHITPQKKRETLEIEVPMLDKTYDDGKGKDYKIGFTYVSIIKENIYVHEVYDIALVRFPTVEGSDLAVVLPAKRKIKVGDTVYAVGNPIAMTDNITKGIFSNRKRFKGKDYMVISSGIIMGNSGGAAINEDGEIVGVVVAISHFITPRPKTQIFVFHLGMCVPQKIMIPFVLEAYENLTQEIQAKTEINN